MRIDDITQASLLYDFYGQLLSKRQKQVMELYHEENLSLSEIASEFDISRQGVHDALKNAEKALKEYEKKLGLVSKFQRTTDAVEQIDTIIDAMIVNLSKDAASADEQYRNAAGQPHDTDSTIDNLKKVKTIIDNLEE